MSGEEVLELDVELFLLLDHHVLLHNLFRLLDQSLLQCLDLLQELPSVGVSSFELAPSVVVQRVFKLLRQCLHLKTLVKQLLMEREGLLLKLVNLRGLGLNNLKFAGQVTDLELKESDVLESFLVLDFALRESRLQNLDLLVQQSKLIISSDKLRAKNIPLVLLVTIQFLQFIIVSRDIGNDFGLHLLLHLLGR